jgi:hypothetical protein
VFPDNNWSSRIVITTRLGSVARSCCSDLDGIVYKLKPLNESDSTQLLMTTAFGSVKDVCLPEGSRDLILRSCNGIPLLITAFADNIKEQLQTAAPNSYGQSPGFSGRTAELHSVEEGPQLPDQVRCALTRICRDLPVELMTLLQYMRMFPRGYMFEKDYLVMKWMAKGLTHSEGEAECHFSELVDRNIFTLVLPTGEHNLDEAEPCRWQVNNLMLQFISSTTRRPAFVFTGDMLTSLEPPTIRPSSELCMPRLVALHSPEPDIQGLMHTIDWGENVRSLAVSGIVDQVPLNKFNYLVMLDLEDWKNLKDEDLLQICNSKMYLLRYLSVRKTQISKLPPQIKELCGLRTLDVSHTQISELPSQAFELDHLIKLDLRSTKIGKLSEKVVGLQKLQYLLVGGDTTLSLIKYPLSFTAALGDLACLRVLTITCSFQQCADEAYQDVWLSSVKKWRQLESLTIHCGLGSSMEFLQGLTSDPPEKLQKLKVTNGRFVSVPQWIKRLEHLSFLQITICKLAADELTILKDLPKLKSLVLGLEFIPREKIVFESEGFNELLEFSVECPVPWLTFRQGAMPKLEFLQLKLCSGPAARRDSVPSGIRNLRSITDLDLCYNQKWCHNSSSVKMTVEAVKEEVAKHRKPISLVINGTVHDVIVLQEYDYLLRRLASDFIPEI